MENQNILLKEILETFTTISNDIYKSNISKSNKVLLDFIPILEDEKDNIKKQSIYFNVFHFFKIEEPMHSKLLATLLDPYGNHGQGKIFLKEFLKEIDIEFKEDDLWQVTAEIGRIDILLKCLNRDSVVIIENKSNYAEDQSNQLYRYWYQEMHLPFQHSTNSILSNKNNFRIIYLSPNNNKVFDFQSIEKPIDWGDESLVLPSKLESNDIQVVTFSGLIVPWLNKCLELKELDKNNSRIREYIKQYVELWKIN